MGFVLGLLAKEASDAKQLFRLESTRSVLGIYMVECRVSIFGTTIMI